MIKKIWHPYMIWEDYLNGMYKTVSGDERKQLLNTAINFTGNANLYGMYMLKVVDSWPISCEHNLSDTGMNRKAWIGHAAACLANGLPEDITREAWASLTKEQQDEANDQADFAIQYWEGKYESQNT